MGRADKVWLTLAIVLVVLFAGGGGALLYRRSQVLAGEQAPQGEATVTLTPLATPTPTPKPAAPVKPRSPGTPPAKGALPGYVTRVRTSGSGYVILFDPGELESGEKAAVDAALDHGVTHHGWYLRNQKHGVTRYALDPKCTIIVSNPLGPLGSTQKMTHKAFKDAFPGGDSENILLQKAAFWIVPKGNRVLRIEQIQF